MLTTIEQIVYVAPMKALAAEMVRNFGARLSGLGILVRELTGDMSLTKQEMIKTQACGIECVCVCGCLQYHSLLFGSLQLMSAFLSTFVD